MTTRTLDELAEMAVDASQGDRVLEIDPDEYGLLCNQHHYANHHVEGWDPAVFQAALARGLQLPLPDVRVVIRFPRG